MTRFWRRFLPSYLCRPKKALYPKKTKPNDTKPLIPQTISLFDLPRELRDQIYHYYWTAQPKYLAPRTPFHPLKVHFNYAGRPDITKEAVIKTATQRFPEWLQASKQLQSEALEQYASRAEWSVVLKSKLPKPDNRKTSSALDIRKVRKLALHISDIAAVAVDDNHTVYQDLRVFSKGLEEHQRHPETMAKIQRLRISGSTYVSILPGPPGSIPKPHISMQTIAEGVARRAADILACTDVEALEFELHQESDCYRRWMMWESTGRGKDGQIRIIDDQTRECERVGEEWVRWLTCADDWPMEGWMMDSFDYHPTYPL